MKKEDKIEEGKIKEEDLIVMTYTSPNECSCTIISIEKAKEKFESFEVDIKRKTWSWSDWKNVPIGKSRLVYDKNGIEVKWGIIGVYNRKNINHLDDMVGDAVYFHRPSPRFDDY